MITASYPLSLIADPPSLEALAEFLQAETEERSRVLARDLHDNLGGSLIAAIMDVAWLTRHAAATDDRISMHLHRIDSSLTKAIEATRRLVDELQPALIESVGLFVAVSAHFGRECRRSGVKYAEAIVGAAPEIDSATAMSSFRVAQGILQWLLEDAGASELSASYEGVAEALTMRFVACGTARDVWPTLDIITPRLSSIALRLQKLKGTLTSEAHGPNITICVRIVLAGA